MLRALAQYHPPEGDLPYGYAWKDNVGFELVLRHDGSHAELRSTYQSDTKGRRTAPTQAVPSITRANNPPPLLGCDSAAFVLALPKSATDGGDQAKELAVAERKNQAFLTLLMEYSASSGDNDPRVYRTWLQAGRPGLNAAIEGLPELLARRLQTDLVQIRVDGSWDPIHAKSAAKEFWTNHLIEHGGGSIGICLVCQQLRATVDTLPQSLIGSRIPATSTANVALVSINFPAASRGARGSGLRSAPVCGPCAASAVSSFNSLAASPKHRWNSGGGNPATIWWISGGSVEDEETIDAINAPKPEQIESLFSSVRKGRPSQLRIDDRFYLTTFKGNVARLVVQRWIDLPLSNVRKHIARWFEDTAGASVDRPYRSVVDLAVSAGPYPGKNVLPEGAVEALVIAAVSGAPPPRALLLRALQRARAEAHHSNHPDRLLRHRYRERAHARAGLIRLILNRSPNKERDMPPNLDEDLNDPAYVAGRIFAVRESLQRTALGEVNASIVNRYFERASANPAEVQHSLTALEKQHLDVLQRKGAIGARIAFDKRLTMLQAKGPAPGRLSPEQQAAWICGYYQQREADFARAAEKKSQTHDDEQED